MLILKPCPFCGAYGQDIKTIKESYIYELKECALAYIKCVKCGGRSGYAATEKEARAKWNKRK